MGKLKDQQFGRYRLLEVVSRGSIGVIYRAYDPMLQREVAIKVLSQARLDQEEDVARFLQEARAVARLSHPNVVPVHEVGSHQDTPYFTMDFIRGKSLASLIREGGALPPRRAVEICREAAGALCAAHARGIVHRDVKPSNIMLAEDGRVLVMDFGLAKDLEQDTLKTQTGTAIGTPAYMPPEQARGDTRNIGAASDVYSLGAVLYECISGHPPFEGRGVMDIVLQVMDYPPVPPRRRNPRIPRDLESIVLKCLDKEPAYRYASMSELERDLGRFLDGEAVEARPPGLGRRLRGFFWRHRAALLGAFAGAVLVVSLLFLLALLAGGEHLAAGRTLAFAAAFESAEPPPADLFSVNTGFIDYREGSLQGDREGKQYLSNTLFSRNYTAELTFKCGPKSAAAGFYIQGRESAPLIAKYEAGYLMLIGPRELERYSYRRPYAGVAPLAAVAAAPLQPEQEYRMLLDRSNLDLTLTLQDAAGPPCVLHYRGLQLTNWRLKEVQIGVISIGPGIASGSLQVWVEVPGSRTPVGAVDDDFYIGEYSFVPPRYEALLAGERLRPEERANCLLHLAYCHEVKYEHEQSLTALERLLGVPEPLAPALLLDGRVRQFAVHVRLGDFGQAASMLGEIEAEWLASPWRFETLPLAEACLAAGAVSLAGRLLQLAARAFPFEVAAPALASGCATMLKSEEYPAALELLGTASFSGRKSLVHQAVSIAVEKGLPVLARRAGALLLDLADESESERREFLVGVLEHGLTMDSPAVPALIEAAGPLAPQVISEVLGRAASAGKLGLLARALALYPRGALGSAEAAWLTQAAGRLLADGHYADVLVLYRAGRLGDLRPAALEAAERLAAQEPTAALEFMLEAARQMPLEKRMLEAAAAAAAALASGQPTSEALWNWFASPLCQPEQALAVMQPLLRQLRLKDASSLGRFLALALRSVPHDLLPALPALLYAAVSTPPVSSRDAEAAFKSLREAEGSGHGLGGRVLLALADVYAVLGHPEAAAVIWDKLAFDPAEREAGVAAQAAMRASVYFALSGRPERGRDYLPLASTPEFASGPAAEILDTAGTKDGAAMLAALKRHRQALPAALAALGDFYAPLYEASKQALAATEEPPDG